MNTVRLRKLLIWLAGAICLYAVIGFFAVPALVKRQAVAHVDRELGHKLELGDVRFNPFTLTARIDGFALSEATGAKLVAFEHLFVNFQAISLLRRTWTFDAIELDAPDIRFELRQDGRHNFSTLLDKLKKPAPEPDTPIPRLTIASIRVNDGRLDVADLPAGADARLSLQPISFELTALSTLPSETSPYKLSARTTDGEVLQWGGDITLNPFASTGKLALQQWKVATLDRLLGNRIGLHSATGQIDLSIDYRAAFVQGQPSLTLSNASLTLADLSLVATDGAPALIGAGKVIVTGGQFDLAQRTLGVERVGIEGAAISLVIADDGRPNWAALLPSTGSVAPTESPHPGSDAGPAAATSAPAPAHGPWQFKLGQLDATAVALSYSDRRAPGATSIAFKQGKLGLGMALEAGQQGVAATLSDLTFSASDVAADRLGDKFGVQSLQLLLSSLKLGTVADQPQMGAEGLKFTIAKATGTTDKRSVRIDAANLAAAGIDLALDKDTSGLSAATVSGPTLDAQGLGAKADNTKELVELRSISLGAKQLRAALAPTADINTDGLRVALDTLVVRESDGSAMAARLRKLEATGGSASAAKRNVMFERILLADGYASTSYAPDGRLNWERLIARLLPPAASSGAPAPSAQTAASEAAWNIAAKIVEADNFGATFTDARAQPPLAVVVQNVKARLRNFDTRGKAPTGVELTGGIMDRGKFQLAGTVEPASFAADIKLKLEGISLAPAQPFLAQYARLKIVSGLLSAEGRLRYGKPGQAGAQIVYEGELGLDKLDVQESDPLQPFLALGSLRAAQAKFTLAPNSLDVPDLRLDRLVTKLLIAEDQSINLVKVLRTAPSTPAGPVAQSVAEAKPATEATEQADAFPVSIGRIRIDRSELEFADLSLRPRLFSTRMHELKGVITGVSTSRDSRARLELDARVDEFGAATIRGSINPFRPRAYTEVDLDFRNIAMTNLSPYSSKFAGYQIASGQMTINLQYRVKNSGLQGNNRIILDNLQLGSRVESPTAMNLPLEFAIAILKDSNGRIDIGLPVTGSLDDPQFSIAGLVWKAIGNLITNIVTAPFRALASLFGAGQNEQLGTIEFDPGSDALRPPERQKLRTVAEALQKRPQLKLTIKPTYAVAADRDAMKSLAMRRAVLTRAGIKLEPGESPGPLDVGNARMQQAIEALYVERFGLPAARDLRASLAKPAPEDPATSKPAPTAAPENPASRQAVRVARAMSNQLMETAEVSDADLVELGKRRAQAISTELQSSAKVEPARLASEAPTASDGKDGQIVSDLDLSAAK